MKSINVEPFFVEKPWGGSFISRIFNLSLNRKIGEAFLVSTLEKQENLINGETLSSFLKTRLPFLIKFIDANENLSIQVHPNDYFAKQFENSTGKTECWLIADSKKGAGIYYGLKDDISLEAFFEHVKLGHDVSTFMNFIPVKKNDFFEVPAGTIHAIGAGVRLVEFQQASGITYRIWDWGREGRELHTDKALKVSNSAQAAPKIFSFDDFEMSSIFFDHQDFSLKKNNTTLVCCFSKDLAFNVIFDLQDYSFRFE